MDNNSLIDLLISKIGKLLVIFMFIGFGIGFLLAYFLF